MVLLSKAEYERLQSSHQSISSQATSKSTPIDSALSERFYSLTTLWQRDVEGLSSTTQMVKHPAYREIVEMGMPIVPLLLQELKNDPLYWLDALHTITGENPIDPEQRGRVRQMADAWLTWGERQGYV